MKALGSSARLRLLVAVFLRDILMPANVLDYNEIKADWPFYTAKLSARTRFSSCSP